MSVVNPSGHVDLRMIRMTRALPFYSALMPALGFGRSFHGPMWKVFAAEGTRPGAAYVAITEDASHRLEIVHWRM